MQREDIAIGMPTYEYLIERYLETHMTFPVVVNNHPKQEEDANPDQGHG